MYKKISSIFDGNYVAIWALISVHNEWQLSVFNELGVNNIEFVFHFIATKIFLRKI
jgi:hypothetical protein